MQLSAFDLRSDKGKALKKLVFYISMVLVAIYVATSFFWTGAMARTEQCRGIRIAVRNDSMSIVSPRFIETEIKRLGLQADGKQFAAINAEQIEKAFGKQYYVEYAQCYRSNDNMMCLDIYPVKPVLRVFERSGASYYINRSGKRVPVSFSIFTDVPVAAGAFSRQYPPERLMPLLDYMRENPEIDNLVGAIEVADSQNVYIIPNIAGHVVNLGSLDNLPAKFGKLFRFYKEVLPVKGWNIYDTISLKWHNQIVAVKRKAVSRLWIQDENLGHEEMPDPLQDVSVYDSSDTLSGETKK